jgi:hypothetical protein
MKLVRVLVNKEHATKLLFGLPIIIKIPEGTTHLELNLDSASVRPPDASIAKIIDVFFNGRKA